MTSAQSGQMTRGDDGTGTRAARARRMRIWVILGAAAAAGFGVGFLSAFVSERDAWGLPLSLPPAFAVAAAVVTVLAIVLGRHFYVREIDELEMQTALWASRLALEAFLLTYFCWWLLWKGGLVPEPVHELLFAGTFLAMTLAYGWKKLRP